MTGWCWGGSTTIQVAATNPDMKAAVAWYGPPARPYQGASGPVTGFDLAKDIKIPFLGLFGENDKSPTPDDAKKLGELVKAQNPNIEIVIYPAAGHGFHADYRPSYNKVAADDAWKRCTGWFEKYLKGLSPTGGVGVVTHAAIGSIWLAAMASSAIEWTDVTWNPITGCDRTSPGCDNCYALTLAKRLKAMGQPKYQNDGDARTSGPGFGVALHEDLVEAPHRRLGHRSVFVNSMSDLFHDAVRRPSSVACST